MTIIKSGQIRALSAVRSVSDEMRGRPAHLARDPASEELEQLKAYIADQGSRLSDLQRQVEQIPALVSESTAKGEAKGYEAGLAAAARLESERLDQLTSAIECALGDWRRHLSELDRSALLIARTALSKILGGDTAYQTLLPDLIRRQVESLDTDSIVCVDVSEIDFPHEDQLIALKNSIGVFGLSLKSVPDLKGGDCRMRLTLGVIDAGVTQQWSSLGDLMEDLAQPEAAV